MGGGTYCAKIADLPPADITLITTPDQAITSCCIELSQNQALKLDSLIIHCSGAYTSDALKSVQQMGCLIASVHPMRSFALPLIAIEHYPGTHCAVECDDDVLPQVCALFNSIGSILFRIQREKKSVYHAAGVFASNYLITLAEQARLCLEEAGVEATVAMNIITNLMQSTVSNLKETHSPIQSLTGPLQRGDIATLQQHIDSLQPTQQQLYCMLGQATLPLTALTNTETTLIEHILTPSLRRSHVFSNN